MKTCAAKYDLLTRSFLSAVIHCQAVRDHLNNLRVPPHVYVRKGLYGDKTVQDAVIAALAGKDPVLPKSLYDSVLRLVPDERHGLWLMKLYLRRNMRAWVTRALYDAARAARGGGNTHDIVRELSYILDACPTT